MRSKYVTVAPMVQEFGTGSIPIAVGSEIELSSDEAAPLLAEVLIAPAGSPQAIVAATPVESDTAIAARLSAELRAARGESSPGASSPGLPFGASIAERMRAETELALRADAEHEKKRAEREQAERAKPQTAPAAPAKPSGSHSWVRP